MGRGKISSKSSAGVGNTKTPAKRQISAARHWGFTLNNYTENDILNLEKIDRSIVPIFVGQSEVGDGTPENPDGTPHLQCTFSYHEGDKRRPIQMFYELLGHKRCSFRSVKPKLMRPYCCKSDRGKDTRGWSFIYGWKKPRPLVKMTYDLLRPEQKKIVDLFKEPCDPLFSRDIYWIWEAKGGVGKTVLSMYFCDQMDALVLGGKASDIFCGVAKLVADKRTPEIFIFDIPRSSNGYISYRAIEKVKDGLFYSGKYDSDMVRFNRGHVVCFANHPPDMCDTTLSEDRWKIFEYSDFF